MPLSKKAILKIKEFNFGVSYRIDEKSLSFKDAQNVSLNDGKLEKRNAIRPLSLANLQDPQSVSYFKKSDLSRYYLIRSASDFSKLNAEDGTVTTISGTLSRTRRHRALTWIDRHIIADADGLFQFDGSVFTQVGQQSPASPLTEIGGVPGSLDAASYEVVISFYSSANGFESAPSSPSNITAITGTDSLKVGSIPTTAANATIDKVRIYARKTTIATYNFYAEIPLGQAEYTIIENSLSSQAPVSDSSPPPSGEVRYICEFNKRLIAVFADDPNTVRGSDEEVPDSFDDDFRLAITGDGPITGIATGLFNDTVLDPYLVIFKENKIGIYSEINGQANLVELNARLGCVSHDSIIVRNGDVYFMSKFGFYGIRNGKLMSKDGQPYPLAGGAILDIFTESGFQYGLNQGLLSKSHSYYSQERDQYVTFVYESVSSKSRRAYCYDFKTDSFLPWTFPVDITHSIAGEDTSGNECPILLQNNELNDINYPNTIFKFYSKNPFSDLFYPETGQTSEIAIDAWAILNWVDGQDYDASFNYRECLIRIQRGQPDITLKAWVNFTYQNESSDSFDVPDPDATFILDESRLDVDALGEGRDIVTSRVDINLAGESVLLGFYQSELDANMVISSMQLEFSKNGNRNK
jgi:hypothetical protein